MRFFSFKTSMLLSGIALTAYGYHLLSIPPDADYELVMSRARSGMFFVVGGGAALMLWLAKR
jgi:hypothetical protein